MHLHKIIFHLSNQTRFDTDKLLRTEALDSSLLHGFVDWFTLHLNWNRKKERQTLPWHPLLLECWWRQITWGFLCIRVPPGKLRKRDPSRSWCSLVAPFSPRIQPGSHHNFDGFGNSCNEALVANGTGRLVAQASGKQG